MEALDPFILFRTLLFVALTTYTVLLTAASIRNTVLALRGADRQKRLLRAYLGYQLWSIRLRRFAAELLTIAFWSTMLAVLWWLHTRID